MPTKLSILIATYRRPHVMRNVIRDLAACRNRAPSGWEMVVVDNAGDAETEAVCRSSSLARDCLRYVHEPDTGLSAARNRAVAEAGGSWFLFLDDDVRFKDTFVRQMLDAVEAFDIDIICPRMTTPLRPDWPRWLESRVRSGVGQFDLGQDATRLDSTTKLPVGACVAIRREVFEQFGPFEKKLDRMGRKLFGGGETQLFWAAFRSGLTGMYLPSIEVRHEFISGKESKGYWRKHGFYGGRSKIRLLGHRKSKGEADRKILQLAVISLFKMVARAAMVPFQPTQAFENEYRAIAHFGILYEAIMGGLEREAGRGARRISLKNMRTGKGRG